MFHESPTMTLSFENLSKLLLHQNMVGVYHHRSYRYAAFLAGSLLLGLYHKFRLYSLVLDHNRFILNPGAIQYSQNMVSFYPTTSIFTETRWNGPFTKLWRVLYITITYVVLLSLHLWTNEFCSWEIPTTIDSLNICTVFFDGGKLRWINKSGRGQGRVPILIWIVLLLGFAFFRVKNLGTSSGF